jgi:hypothetical protein
MLEMNIALKNSKFRDELLDYAIDENKIIIIMRNDKMWLSNQHFKKYANNTNNVFIAINNQNISFSKNNILKYTEYLKLQEIKKIFNNNAVSELNIQM